MSESAISSYPIGVIRESPLSVVDPTFHEKERLKNLALQCLLDKLQNQPEKIKQGLLQDDLFERLSEEIIQARKSYFQASGLRQSPKASFIFDSILNDYLLAEQSFIACPIW